MSKKTLAQILVAHNQGRHRKRQHKSKPQKRTLKPRKGRHSNNWTYLSGTYTEYKIKQDDFGYYYIRPYGGGKVAKVLDGKWSTFVECERVLIQWLEKTDVRQQSRYPGCPERKRTNYTRTFLEA